MAQEVLPENEAKQEIEQEIAEAAAQPSAATKRRN